MVKSKNKNIVNKEIVSTISSKGQVTVPVEIREFLGLMPNDKLAFVVKDSGNIEIERPKYPDLESIFGSAGTMKEPMDLEEVIKKSRAERISKRYLQ